MQTYKLIIVAKDRIQNKEEQIYEKVLDYDVSTGHIFSSSEADTFIEEIETVVRSHDINRETILDKELPI